jgi:hypothetical protein
VSDVEHLPEEEGDDEEKVHRPAPRTRISLLAPSWGTSVASVVEDVLAVDLAVTAPHRLRDVFQVSIGDEVSVSWEEPMGPYRLACTLAAVLEREIPQWQLRPQGDATPQQRRRHARAATEDRVELVHERRAVRAGLTDISEAGMRCQLGPDESPIGVGEIVSTELDLEGMVVTLHGEVVRVQVDGLGRELSVAFEEVTPATADLLRRRVFAEQAAARARSIT